jgi:hypothetical protein
MEAAKSYTSEQLEQFKNYIEEIKRSFDTSIEWIKLSVQDKKTILIEKFAEIKSEFSQNTKTNLDHFNQLVEVILATDPLKKFQEITENVSTTIANTLKEMLETLHEVLANEEMSKIITNLTCTLDNIFFSNQKREENFQQLASKENPSTEEINNFLNKIWNKTTSTKEWKQVLQTGILNWSLWLTQKTHIEDRIKILSTLSYYSLQTCLRVWIDTWLFIQNVMKFFPQKSEEMKEFQTNFDLSWWLALTEKSSWTNLFVDMFSTYEENTNWNFVLEWEKHFQWLTNEADIWLWLATKKWWKEKKIFYVDTRLPWVNVEMIEEYQTSWLKSITYWVNKIKATVSNDCVFIPLDQDSFLRSFQSSLFDSRMQFPAMGSGYLKRLFRESCYKASLRKISWWKMIDNESVKEKIAYIQWYHDIINWINKYLIAKNVDLAANNKDKEALSIICKTISTEYMITSWAKARDLQAAEWFKQDNTVRSMAEDAWPFSRFEGVNEMLYWQLAHKYSKENISTQLSEEAKKHLQINNITLDNIEETSLTKENIGKIYARTFLINMFYEIWWINENSFIILTEEIKQTMVLAERTPLTI